MSQYIIVKGGKKLKGTVKPILNRNPTKISLSKIDLFIECPKCFYLDKVLGIKRPSGPSFSLNLSSRYSFKIRI